MQKSHFIVTIVFIAGLFTFGCGFNTENAANNSESGKPGTVFERISYKDIQLKNADGDFQAVIEIPAGTNKKIEIDYESNSFKIDKREGRERIISFLPYPANYGFIAGTLSDKEKGGDGDAVDIFVIAEHLKTGTVISVEPIAMLKLIDDGEEDFKVIAVPVDESQNVLNLKELDVSRNRDKAILDIFEKWLLNYDTDPAKVLGWANKQETLEYINNNLKK